MRRILFITFFGLFAVGCSTSKHTVNFEVGAKANRDVVVLGDKPFVEVENHGPGSIFVLFPGQERVTIGPAATGATVRGPARVKIGAAGGGFARVTVTSSGGDGLALGSSKQAK